METNRPQTETRNQETAMSTATAPTKQITGTLWETLDKSHPETGWQPCEAERVLRWARAQGESPHSVVRHAIEQRRPIHGAFAIYRVRSL